MFKEIPDVPKKREAKAKARVKGRKNRLKNKREKQEEEAFSGEEIEAPEDEEYQ